MRLVPDADRRLPAMLLMKAARWLPSEKPSPQHLMSGDPLDAYLALWAMGETKLDDALVACRELLVNGSRGSRIAAMYYANRLRELTLKARLAAAALDEPSNRADPVMVSLALDCLKSPYLMLRSPRFNSSGVVLTDQPNAALFSTQSAALLITREERDKLYGNLKRIVDAFPGVEGDSAKLNGGIFLGDRVRLGQLVPGQTEVFAGYAVSDVLDAMIYLLSRLVPAIAPSPHGRQTPPVHAVKTLPRPAPLDMSPTRISPSIANTSREWGIETEFMIPMLIPAANDELDAGGSALRDELCGYWRRMNEQTRRNLLLAVVRNGVGSPVQHETLIRAFASGEHQAATPDQQGVSSTALGYSVGLTLTEDEVRRLEGFLDNRDGMVRQSIMTRLLMQEPEAVGRSVERLLLETDPERHKAGLERLALLSKRKDDPRFRNVYAVCARLADAPPLPGPENGYGLYDPSVPPISFVIDEVPDYAGANAGYEVFHTTAEEIENFITAVEEVLAPHIGFRYRIFPFRDTPDLEKYVELRREDVLYEKFLEKEERNRKLRDSLDDYPLTEVWRTMLREKRPSPECLRILAQIDALPSLLERCSDAGKTAGWVRYLRELADSVRECAKEQGLHPPIAKTVAQAALKEMPVEACYPAARRLLLAALSLAPATTRESFESTIYSLFMQLNSFVSTKEDALFRDYFQILYQQLNHREQKGLLLRAISAEDLVRVYKLGILPENDYLRLLLNLAADSGKAFSPLADARNTACGVDAVPGLRTLLNRVIDRIVNIETARGDLATNVSEMAGRLEYFTGVNHFVDLVAAAGDQPFTHDSFSNAYVGLTRIRMLSLLLTRCHPAPGDSAAALTEAVKQCPVSPDRLRAAAAYAPQ